MFRGRSTERLLVTGKGFAFAVEMCDFFSRTASEAVSDTICQVFFYIDTGKCSQNSWQNLKKDTSIFVLVTGTFSWGKIFDQGRS